MTLSGLETPEPVDPEAPVSGLELLKAVWKIQDKKPRKKYPKIQVSSDIYRTPSTKNPIPKRSHSYQ
jgi:hypothetical protein